MKNGENLNHSFNHNDICDGNFNRLTKREYFAGLAMQGLLANPNGGRRAGITEIFSPNGVSELALLHADALIASLENTGDTH